MATFGKTTIGSQNNAIDANEKYGSQFTLAEQGDVTSISAYFGDSGYNAKAAIYASDGIGGAPGTLLVQSASKAVTVGWNTFNISTTNIPPASYWLMIMVDGAKLTNGLGGRYDVDGRSLYTYSTYATEFLNPCQPMSIDDDGYPSGITNSIYATYTPSAPIPYSVTISAHCNTDNVDLALPVTLDSEPTPRGNTPLIISNLLGTHTITLPSTDAEGHSFLAWDSGSPTTNTITVTASGSHVGYYQALPPTGTTPWGPTELAAGRYRITMASPVISGTATYYFSQWSDGNLANPRDFDLTTTLTLTAQYTTPVTAVLTLSVSPPDAGTVVANPSPPYTLYQVVWVTAFPSTGYQFAYWLRDGLNVGSTNPYQITMDTDHALQAVFLYQPPSPTLTLIVLPSGFGTISVNPLPPYQINEVVTITATPIDPAHYRFLKWIDEIGGDYSLQNTTTVTMTGDRTLTAIFEEFEHPTLVLVTSPAEGGTLIAEEPPPYLVGQIVHVAAQPATKYVLSGWLRDGLPFDAKDNPVAITLDQSYVLTAVFSPTPCFIATAAYGTPFAHELNTLRSFRDNFMLTNKMGEMLVKAYYSIGKYLARIIQHSELLRYSVRTLLSPVVDKLRKGA